ncbi:major facilitator superfamily protein [Gracilibacillus halophilus YIM-C55.5]|uniref:Major facilitator superfamily protein n=1 Tax=Gracilibacillus halophilus YIM-C55.5 TaxID=1308866 RepID=N4WB34_9BACI|nr:MFS transporter [Gracilibacillus halophilus]ENH96469.1 major facilitator superfamily protein [Gracilibacillus halophilus YIM-C55.5]
MVTSKKTTQLSIFIFILGIILLAFNLRPAITAVGPIIATIRDDLALDNWNAGLITSLPLLAFSFMSPIAPRIANRLGNERTLLFGLLILLAGIVIRLVTSLFFLYMGTIFAGIGIAIINVILPSLIKANFPNKIGLMTGMYTTSMSILAATASGLSVPLTNLFHHHWEWSLGSWGLLTVLGIIVWTIAMRYAPAKNDVTLFEPSAKKMFCSKVAWQVTLFMGLQSFLFYVTISWLPEILQADGFSANTAGWFVAYMQFISLPATFITPIIAGKLPNQQPVVFVFGLVGVIGYTGLLFSHGWLITVILVTLIGFTLGASISLALALLGLRTTNARQAAELSGMAQSFGYLLASVGPMLIGFLFDITSTWQSSIVTIIFITCTMTLFGLAAGRNKYVIHS